VILVASTRSRYPIAIKEFAARCFYIRTPFVNVVAARDAPSCASVGLVLLVV